MRGFALKLVLSLWAFEGSLVSKLLDSVLRLFASVSKFFTVLQFSMRIRNWKVSKEDLDLLMMDFDECSVRFAMYLKITMELTNGVPGKITASEVACEIQLTVLCVKLVNKAIQNFQFPLKLSWLLVDLRGLVTDGHTQLLTSVSWHRVVGCYADQLIGMSKRVGRTL